MAQIRPFCGICPREDAAEQVAALPYDVYNRREAREEVCGKPLSFLRIDRPETQFADDADMYAPQVYQKAHDLLWEMVEKGILVKEKEPCYYIYELTMNGRVQNGLVACAAVDDYVNGVIRKHENTREEKEQDRIRHVDACDAQTGPIFLAYRRNEIIHRCIQEAKTEKPIFSFTSADGITHRGWRIADQEAIRRIEDAFKGIGQIYIADGHHRAASAVKVSLMRREAAKKQGYQEGLREYDVFLSVLFAHDELYIMDYNRVVSDLNGNTSEELLQKISHVCEITPGQADAFRPKEKGSVGMYLDGMWYGLKFKKEFCTADPVEGLDVSILQKQVLEPILGIGDPRTDERISFVGGIRGLEELERLAKSQGGAAFAMYPTSMEELFDVADAGRLMPPKSTWFEPKLRSGLFIHSLK